MTGLDTNVVIRFFVDDDRKQFQKAGALLASFGPQNRGFIPVVSLVETVWVLRTRYGVSKALIVERLERILEAPELELENESAIEDAVRRFAMGRSEFADYVIEAAARGAGCSETVTFDREAARSAGMRLM
jgi:predicted nucleic-acid-binding protein